jgi:hypothetical protein
LAEIDGDAKELPHEAVKSLSLWGCIESSRVPLKLQGAQRKRQGK